MPLSSLHAGAGTPGQDRGHERPIGVRFDAADTAGCLEALAASLGAIESECDSVVEVLSREFQSLAARVSEIVRLAELTVRSIETGTVGSIPARVASLVGAAEKFVLDRLEAGSTVLEVACGEQALVETLLRINAEHRSIAREIHMLALLTSIEVARLGEHGSGFQYLVKELNGAAETVSGAAREFTERAISGKGALNATHRRMAAALPRLRKKFQGIEGQLQRALAEVNVSVDELSACPAEVKGCVETVADRISGVVSAIQSHDITRQQTGHVRDAVETIAARLATGDGGPSRSETALVLRVQARQLANVRQAMDGWSAQIDECLESILHISQTRLESATPRILAQEKLLSGHLAEIEEVEKECESDSAGVEEALSDVSGLLSLVREHSGAARLTRDRLQLLSFNSIIESRNLGGKADVMQEISRTLTRIASEWREMAQKSASTQDEIQRMLDEAHAGMASLSLEKDRELQNARLDIVNALGDLKTAAQSAAAHAADMGKLTTELHEQIATARFMSGSLQQLTARLGYSMEELEALEDGMKVSAEGQECDREALEALLSPAYTTEIERAILRSALYGEAVDAAALNGGNDVELF